MQFAVTGCNLIIFISRWIYLIRSNVLENTIKFSKLQNGRIFREKEAAFIAEPKGVFKNLASFSR